MTGYKVRYHGPTDHNGSRFTITNLQTGKRVTVPYNHAASNAKVAAILKAFPDAFGITYIGEDSQASYYAAQSERDY